MQGEQLANADQLGQDIVSEAASQAAQSKKSKKALPSYLSPTKVSNNKTSVKKKT